MKGLCVMINKALCDFTREYNIGRVWMNPRVWSFSREVMTLLRVRRLMEEVGKKTPADKREGGKSVRPHTHKHREWKTIKKIEILQNLSVGNVWLLLHQRFFLGVSFEFFQSLHRAYHYHSSAWSLLPVAFKVGHTNLRCYQTGTF